MLTSINSTKIDVEYPRMLMTTSGVDKRHITENIASVFETLKISLEY